MKLRPIILICLLHLIVSNLPAQQSYNLQSCIKCALEKNHNLKKSRLDREKSIQAGREMMGALLPQINASANVSDNIKNMSFIMSNFMANDPTDPKYMSLSMGTPYSASAGIVLNQQLLNFSLFNAVEISKMAQQMAALGVESKEEDIISQTANLYYAVQVTDYVVVQFDKSIGLMDQLLKTMEVSLANGLIKKVDVDRLKVARSNLMTQRDAIQNAIDVQKNLLKLQMGLNMDQPIEVEPVDLRFFEDQSERETNYTFDLNLQTPYRIIQQQQELGLRQKKAAVYESFPVLTLSANYQMNWANDRLSFGDDGEVHYRFPTSAIGLNFKLPIFSGLSRTAKIRQTVLEQKKLQEDALTLEQSLNMAYLNAVMKLQDSRKTIQAQRENRTLAQEVYDISEKNFAQGIASMSDVLNANSSLIQSQVSYADALNNYMKAYIDLRKANGTIRGLMEKN